MTRIVDIEGTVGARTALAVLFEEVQTGNKGWLPLSQIEIGYTEGKDIAVVTLPEWLAQEKGMI